MNISGINAYLQLHVVPKTAYKVLLGRPFDVLMATTIHNKRNGEQLITVQDLFGTGSGDYNRLSSNGERSERSC